VSKYILLGVFVCALNAWAKTPLPLPSPNDHQFFLLNDWKPNAPTVIAFKDPFCPYCIKALERRNDLSRYNVFLFWYPIFGEKSHNRIGEFFKCAHPVGDQVIKAAISRQSPNCANPPNETLQRLNREMYEAYSPTGVPAFYLGGKQVDLTELNQAYFSPASKKLGVTLDWQRYQMNRLNSDTKAPHKNQNKVAIYIEDLESNPQAAQLITKLKEDTKYEWYLFPGNIQKLSSRKCRTFFNDCNRLQFDQLKKNVAEFKLLFDLKEVGNQQNPLVVYNGIVLSEKTTPQLADILQLKDVIHNN
jgi:hypothetical protein